MVFVLMNKKNVDSIKIRKNHKEYIYIDYLKANDKLDSIKRQFEKDISFNEYFT